MSPDRKPETFSFRNNESRSIVHNCGIAGMVRTSDDYDLVKSAYSIGVSLQARGHEGFGVWATDGYQVERHKEKGMVAEVMNDTVINKFHRLKPKVLIEQTRYSTSGDEDAWQPFESKTGLAVVQNGNLTNAVYLIDLLPEELREKVKSDTWIATHLLDLHQELSDEGKIAHMAQTVDGAANFIIGGKDCIYALRDYKGFRPLVIGKLPNNGGYVAVSETAALKPLGARYLREVEPGEGVKIDATGPHTFFLDSRTDPEHLSRCIFELIYFASPDSLVYGIPVYKVRERIGEYLAETDFKNGFIPDVIGYIQESGLVYAEGYARAMIHEVSANYEKYGISKDEMPDVLSSLLHRLILVKNTNVTRVFTSPNGRMDKVRLKHRVNHAAFKDDIQNGKINIVVVDDSKVRGDTSKPIIAMFQDQDWYQDVMEDMGIDEVEVNMHWRDGSHDIQYGCYMGMDFPKSDELIAYRNKGNIKAIAEEIGAASLHYATHGQVVAAATGNPELAKKFDKHVYEENGFCGACFTGIYPVDISGVLPKNGI